MSELTRFLVLSNPAAGMEDEFNEWYKHVHTADVLQVPGLVSAQRFKLHQIALPDSGEGAGSTPVVVWPSRVGSIRQRRSLSG
jgi:hypothetical protein